MKLSSRLTATSLEPLESRIAPATLRIGALPADNNENVTDTEYNEINGGRPDQWDDLLFTNVSTSNDPISMALKAGGTINNAYFVRLEAGDTIERFTDSDQYATLVHVNSGSVIVFFTDLDGDNEFEIGGEGSIGELTGISMSANASVQIDGTLYGDVVTNLNTHGTKDVSDDTLDMAGLVGAKQGIKFISASGVTGNILSGGDIKSGVVRGDVKNILAGEAANGATFDFFQVAGGEGVVSFIPEAGVKGSSISKMQIHSVTGRVEAGDGGFGAAGGKLSGIQIVSDADGFSLIGGDGGGGSVANGKFNGGSGGGISNILVAGLSDLTLNSNILIKAGNGGDASTTGKGGKGGSMKDIHFGFQVSGGVEVRSGDLLSDNLRIESGAGGSGQVGGAGGSLDDIKVRTATPDQLGGGDEIAVIAGAGGNSVTGGGKAGAGGSVKNAEILNQIRTFDSDTLVQAGDGGITVAGSKGASGGSVSKVSLLGFDLQVIGGDGSDGSLGGKGGGISRLTVVEDAEILAQNVLFSAGRGGNASAGSAGSGGNISGVRVASSDFESFLINPATGADGGASTGGKGGKGGTVSNFDITDIDIGQNRSGILDVRAGRGGDGDFGGGAGGSLTRFFAQTAKANVSLAASDGGNALVNGAGGKGGSMSFVQFDAEGIAFGLPLTGVLQAGDGGLGVGANKAGGKGGDVKSSNLRIEGSGSVLAGNGGGGQAPLPTTAGGAAGSGGSLLSAGVFATGGDATLIAGNAGGTGAKPGNGGNITGKTNSLVGLRGDLNLVARAGDGSFGGNGGTIRNMSYGSANIDGGSDQDPLTPTPAGSILIQAGNGSQGPAKAGKGGSILSVNGAASSGANQTVQILAGDGGGDVRTPDGLGGFTYAGSGKAAAGGSISDFSMARGGAAGGVIVFEAGDAGHSGIASKGASGGSIKGVAINDVTAETLIRSFGAGDGGDANGKGGNGGSVSDVQVLGHDIGVRTGQYYGYTTMGGIFAGTAGRGAKAGVAGSVTNVSADAIAAIVAGKSDIPQLASKISNITLNDDNQILVRNQSFVGNNNFTLTYNGQTTNEIPGNATAQQVANALNQLPDVAKAGGVTVVGYTNDGGYFIQFGSTQESRTDSSLSAAELEVALESLPSVANFGDTTPGVTVTAEAGGLRVTINNDNTSVLIPNGATPAQIASALNASSLGTAGIFSVAQENQNGALGDYVIRFMVIGTGDKLQIAGTEMVPVDVLQKVRGAITDLTATETRPGELPLDVDELRSGSDPITFVETTRGEFVFTASETVKGDNTVTPGVSEVQVISLSPVNGFPTAQFALTFDGEETALISAAGNDVTIANNIDTALEALTTVQGLPGTPGQQVTVTPSATTPRAFNITFDGQDGDVATIVGRFLVPEVQRYVLSSDLAGIPGAAYQIEFGGQTTAPIAANATPAQVDAALEALSSVQALTGPAGNKISVSSPGTNVFDITFNSNGDQTTFTGFTLVPEVQQLDLGSLTALPNGKFRLNFDGPTTYLKETTIDLPATATALDVQNALNDLDSVKATGPGNTGSVTVTSGSGGVFVITFNQNGEQALIEGTAVVQEVQNIDLRSILNTPAAEFTISVQTSLPVSESRQFISTDLPVTVVQEGGPAPLPVAVSNGTPTTSEFDTINFNSLRPAFDTTGFFQLSFQDELTPLLPANATLAQIDAALEALPTIQALGGTVGNQVTVAAAGANQVRVTFTVTGDVADPIVATAFFPEVQVVSFGNPPLYPAGYSILEFQGERTAPPTPGTPLPAGPTPAQVDAALDQFASIPGGVTAVAGPNPGDVRITFNTIGDQDLITAINYLPEAQTIDLTSIVGTSAEFNLAFNGSSTTTPLSSNATAADIDAALESLASVAAIGGVTVSETSPGSHQFEVFFVIDGDLPSIQATTTLPPGTTQRLPATATAAQIETELDAVTVGGVTVTPGTIAGTFDVLFNTLGDQPLLTFTTYEHEIQTVDVYDVGQFFLRNGAEQTPLLNPPPVVPDPFHISPDLQLQLDASAQAVQDALNALPSISAIGGVTVTANADTSYDIVFKADGDQASLGGIQPEVMPTETIRPGTDSLAEQQNIHYFPKNEINPVRYVFANFVGAIADLNEHNANMFHYVDIDGNGTFNLGDRPLDGIMMANVIDQTTLNFTPEARFSLNGFFDNDNVL